MKLMKRFEDIFAAVAFAEEGEHDTAVRIMAEGKAADDLNPRTIECGENCDSMHPAKA